MSVPADSISQQLARVPVFQGRGNASALRVAIVASRFNELVVEPLVVGAQRAFLRAGGRPEALQVAWVPGAFEVPLVAKTLAASGRVDAVVALGAVVRGATPHFDYVAGQAASGVMQASLATGVPVVFGVLTCDTVEQAMDRAGLKAGNKGSDAMAAAIETAELLQQLAHAPRGGSDASPR